MSDICQRPSFCGECFKNLKFSPDKSFDVSFQRNALASLLLFSFVCSEIDLSNIKWNKIATSMASTFNNTGSLHLNFSVMINRCKNFWFSKNLKCVNFNFEENRSQKRQIFQFFKRPSLWNRWPYQDEYWRVLRTTYELSKKHKFESSAKV